MSLFKFFTGMSITKKDHEADEKQADEEAAEARQKSEDQRYENWTGNKTAEYYERQSKRRTDPN